VSTFQTSITIVLASNIPVQWFVCVFDYGLLNDAFKLHMV